MSEKRSCLRIVALFLGVSDFQAKEQTLFFNHLTESDFLSEAQIDGILKNIIQV